MAPCLHKYGAHVGTHIAWKGERIATHVSMAELITDHVDTDSCPEGAPRDRLSEIRPDDELMSYG